MGFLEIAHVVKRFGDFSAVNSLSMKIDEGEIIVVLGPSGCGKTTLLRLICGLEQNDAGSISLNGNIIDKVPPHKRNVAMVFQNYALYPHMTARQNMEFALKIAKLKSDEIKSQISTVAETLNITKLLDKFPAQCSGGERQRIALGRAIVRKPSLFLFDEPLSNLDAGLREILRVELRTMLKKLHATALYVTHDQAEAMTIGDRIAVMKDGILQQIDTPKQVYDNPINGFVAAFLGMPRINVFQGSAVDGFFKCGSEIQLPCPISDRPEITLMVRPEFLIPDPTGNIEAKIATCEYQGDRTVLHMLQNGTKLTSVVHSSGGKSSFDSDQTLKLSVPTSRTMWFESPLGARILPEKTI